MTGPSPVGGTNPWGSSKVVAELMDQVASFRGQAGIEFAIQDVNERVLDLLPSGLIAAALFQSTLLAARWSRYGPDHHLAVVGVVTVGAILIQLWLALRKIIPARRAQAVWASATIAILLNILLHLLVEFDSGLPFRVGAMAVMVTSSFLLFSFRAFSSVIAMGLIVCGVGIAAVGWSPQALIGLALAGGAVYVAWTVRVNTLSKLLSERVSELGEAARKRSFAAKALRARVSGADPGGQAASGLLVYDLGQVVDCNEAFLKLVGRPGKDVLMFDVRELFVERDRSVVAAELAYPSEEPIAASVRKPDGETVPVRLTAHSLDWQGRRLTLVSITDLRREDAWRIQAETDALTGLPNRLQFLAELELAMRRFAANRRHGVAVIYLDLEGFKAVNDIHGHDVGDQMLRAVASRLENAVRPEDVAVRLGGDEFAVLVQGLSGVEPVEKIAARIRRDVEQPMRVGDRSVACATSLGAVVATADDDNAEAILKRADRAMYADKQRRGGCSASSESGAV